MNDMVKMGIVLSSSRFVYMWCGLKWLYSGLISSCMVIVVVIVVMLMLVICVVVRWNLCVISGISGVYVNYVKKYMKNVIYVRWNVCIGVVWRLKRLIWVVLLVMLFVK